MAHFDSVTKVWEGLKLPYPVAADTFLGEVIISSFDATPERVFQINHDEQVNYTCRELKTLSIRIAMNLIKMNIRSDDDVVGMLCRNSSHLLPIMFGSFIAGAPINPLYYSFFKYEIIEMFSLTNPKVVFCDYDVYDVVKETLDEMNSEAEIYTTIKKLPGVKFVGDLLEKVENEENFVPEKFDQDPSKKLAAILCSSGTTGPSKGCLIPHKYFLGFAYDKGSSSPMTSFRFSPIYWITGTLGYILPVFHAHETVVSTTQPFSIELLVELIEKYSINLILVAPAASLNLFLDSPLIKQRDLSSLQVVICTGTTITEFIREKFKRVFPDRSLAIAYGMTEVILAALLPGECFDGLRVGKALPNTDIKVVDANGNGLDIGEIGEIYVKSESMFIGYLKNPEAFKKSFSIDGYFKTDDMGYIDDQGNIYLIDRQKHVFKCNGFTVNIRLNLKKTLR
jgi:4-coumarate--CoA ligase